MIPGYRAHFRKEGIVANLYSLFCTVSLFNERGGSLLQCDLELDAFRDVLLLRSCSASQTSSYDHLASHLQAVSVISENLWLWLLCDHGEAVRTWMM
jgi:hypothetical protein